jgi:NTP pyrophosphatase (non-canonical NTP hydrolase)
MILNNEFDIIREWAKTKGIYNKGDKKTQFIKLQEEVGELAVAILKNKDLDFIDAIGDCVIVLTNLAALENIKIEDCINNAYNEIANREGNMVNGTFVKNEK